MFQIYPQNKRMSRHLIGLIRTTEKEKALISQGFMYRFVFLCTLTWCPGPGSNRYTVAGEGF